MNVSKTGHQARLTAGREFALVAVCLVLLLAFFFGDGFRPGRTIFNNDGPLGSISCRADDLPSGFLSYWFDLNWLGNTGPSAPPDITQTLASVAGLLNPKDAPSKLIFSRVFAPFSLLFLGLSAWFCLRRLGLRPMACVLGAIAVTLNSGFFSTSCWGVASQSVCFGLNFLALGLLADQHSPKRLARTILAGLAVGMGVMEAYDIGAIFSMFIAGFVLFQALTAEGTLPRRLTAGLSCLVIVALAAGFIAAGIVAGLVSTQIQGVAGMAQDPESKARRWDEATQWSLPKKEALSFAVPGLFGYRMDTPHHVASFQSSFRGGNYWGAVGRHPAWDRYFAAGKQGQRPDSRYFFLRFSGGGPYAGVLVVLVAVWAVCQSFRKDQSPFSLSQQRFIWFWSAIILLCLLMAFGRFAPVYQLFYALPYASTIRNPAKFAHLVEFALTILFALGLHSLSVRYMDTPAAAVRGLSSQLQNWWGKATAFDKKWIKGSAAALAMSALGWLFYANSSERLVAYLHEIDFEVETAKLMAAFSIGQAGRFVFVLAVALALLALILSGYFAGRRARTGAILLGILLVIDLGWADLPWVITYNYEQKLASNPILDFLREKPYEYRVAKLPFQPPPQFGTFDGLYDIEWKQHQFPFYNIQCLDVVQNPRASIDFVAFESALSFDRSSNTLHRISRRWELTNTRYLLGATGFLEVLNQQLDPLQHRFRIAKAFDLGPKPEVPSPSEYEELTAALNPNGQYALFEFTGALPRVKLYNNWEVITNDTAALQKLSSADFDPHKTLIVTGSVNGDKTNHTNSVNRGSVEFTSYSPKQIMLKAAADLPSVLLLNDKFDPGWRVFVDGKPAELLRCNYVMRGVYFGAGQHVVEFRFVMPLNRLYVSLLAVIIGLGMIGYLVVSSRRVDVEQTRTADKASKPQVAVKSS